MAVVGLVVAYFSKREVREAAEVTSEVEVRKAINEQIKLTYADHEATVRGLLAQIVSLREVIDCKGAEILAGEEAVREARGIIKDAAALVNRLSAINDRQLLEIEDLKRSLAKAISEIDAARLQIAMLEERLPDLSQ
jgi:capsule polysaccharide export protein KpsE/RkpR